MASFNNGKNLFIVVQLQKDEKEALRSLTAENAPNLFGSLSQFAYILHDKDVEMNGEPKGLHAHIVLKATEGKSSANWLNYFADALKLPKEAINLQIMAHEKKSIRYLLHLDNADKFQYERDAVISNMRPLCEKYWNDSTSFVKDPTLEQLKNAFAKGGSQGIYNLVGLSAFDKAMRVLDRFGADDEDMACVLHEVARLKECLFSFTANPEYIRKGYIPMKDFNDVLVACSQTFDMVNEFAKKRNDLK